MQFDTLHPKNILEPHFLQGVQKLYQLDVYDFARHYLVVGVCEGKIGDG